jgi:hypothetical protein
MDRQTYGQIDRWTNEHMGKIKTDTKTNRYLGRVIETNREMEKQTNGETVKWRNSQMDKQSNGQTDKWTNRQMDKHILGNKTFRK